MEMICDCSREGNDCWIKEKWYWCKDFGILIRIYDDGGYYGPAFTRIDNPTDTRIPNEVREILPFKVKDSDWRTI